MENEEKNIQDNIDETKKELDLTSSKNIEEVQADSLALQEANETEKIQETQEIEQTKKDEEVQEEITEAIEEKITEEPQISLEEKLKAQDEFSFLDEIEKKEENQEIEQKLNKSTENGEIVSFVDDFEQNHQSEELITVRPIKFQQFEQTPPNRTIKKNLDIMQDISMHISVELGRTKSTIREVMEMEQGTVVELEKIAGEQVEIFVNDKLVAKGEVIVIEDKFGVRITSTNIQKQI